MVIHLFLMTSYCGPVGKMQYSDFVGPRDDSITTREESRVNNELKGLYITDCECIADRCIKSR